ncbi:efflux RND transporter permease subunit [Ornithinimicrobium cryptoxanthini]|uniref:Efflux RND transporter permease subunit n=1 Tax=Ornithinimicrobium cryptoxanthini TaxID=2934161 RepID=A0ABY4YHK3_9MICO|nr:efflux RND transporter permease subunit [Ornithinimicrobium cryptoxanthini]USQ76193.1 efflux RND transporter permease subunit [Ornithinimicrobium cryptoxanthini]
MTKLTRFSLHNRALIALTTLFAIFFGLNAMSALPRELFPSLQFPVLAVATPVPDASAAVVEEQVSDRIETAAQGLDNVVEVQSQSSEGFSVVTIELDYGTDLGSAQTNLQRAVLGLQGLPEDAEPQIIAGNIDDFPIIQLSATGGDNPSDLLQRLRDVVIPDLEDLDGVRDVQLTGIAAQIVRVDLDPEAAAQAGVSGATVAQLLQANGVLVPAGTITDDGEELLVTVGSRLGSVEELAALPLVAPPALPGAPPALPGAPPAQPGAPAAPTQPTSPPLTLGDVAEVELTEQEATAYTRTNGEPSVGLSITKTPDGNAVNISHALTEITPELEEQLGGGELRIIFDQAPFIEQSIEGLTTEGLLGLGFAILIVLLFLFSLRLTLVTAVSIPLSLLIAMLGLQGAGYSLNILTLGALTISIGRVVDDSIVVIENIKRHNALGEDRLTSIQRAVREVAGAITSATVATVAVFLPMAFVGGQIGELFRPFALTIAIAMGASLLVALTIIPVLGFWFLGRGPDARAVTEPDVAEPDVAEPAAPSLKTDAPDRLQRGFLKVLRPALAHPVWSLLLAVALLAGTGVAATQLKTDFIGDSGANSLTVTLSLPSGSTLEETDAASRELEDWLSGRPEVESYQATVGSSGGIEAVFLGGGANTSTLAVTLAEGTDGDTFGATIKSEAPTPETANLTATSANAAPGATELQVIVTGQDQEDLASAADDVTQVLKDVGAEDVTNNLTDTVPGLEVTVDRAAAAQLGITETQVGQAVASAMGGSTVGRVVLGTQPASVVVHQGEPPADLAALEDLTVGAGPEGEVVLGDVATLERVDQQVRISRIDGIRSANITATATGDDLGALTAQVQEGLDGLDLPEGIRATIGGVSAEQADAFASLGLALLAAIAIVYLVMVATFNSLVQPLLLMVSVPFAATGSIAMLLLTDTPLDVAAMIGMLMLVGIVVTNAIVLIDLVNQYRRRGLEVHDALIEGARHRFRPIVMTALATIGALTPMALSITGGGAFISQPLALVVIGGLLSSTVLTLLLVPVLYRLVEGWNERRRQRRGKHAPDAPEVVTAS